MKNAGARNLACSKAVCSNSNDKDCYQKIEASFKPWIIGGATNWRVFRHSCDESRTVTHVTSLVTPGTAVTCHAAARAAHKILRG